MAYDSRCYDLAEVFLEDEPTLRAEAKKAALAQSIQDAIEDWIQWERDHAERLAAEASKGRASHRENTR